jgi:hypothetical protein
MKPARLLLLVAFLAVLTSCVTWQIVPQASENTSIKYNRGQQTLMSGNDEIAVVVSAQLDRDQIYFQFIVKNLSDQSLYVDDHSVRLTETSPLGGFPADIKVYDADEYLKMRQKEILAGQILMAVTAGMSTMNAGRTTTVTTVTTGPYGYYGRGRRSYYRGFERTTYTTTTYDSALAAYQTEIAFSNVRQYINGTNRELDYLKDTLFFPTDIDPHGEYYGLVVAKMGETAESLMKLSADFGNMHFDFNFRKDQINLGD